MFLFLAPIAYGHSGKHSSAVELPANVRVAALGEGTAKTLRTFTGRVDFIGQGSPGQVAEQFKSIATGTRVFFPRARNSSLTIQHLLADHITTLDVVCYDNEPVPVGKPIKTDIFIFTSPLNVAAYFDHQRLVARTRVLAIGGSTAAARYQRGHVAAYPQSPSEEALVALLERRSVHY